MTDITALTLSEAKTKLDAGELSSRELTQAFLDRIESKNGELNAYITVTDEFSLAAADEADKRIAAGEARTLEGLPIAVKDLFCTKGVQSTAGSKMLKGFIPPYESTVTQNLFDQGMVMLGKTNLDEFAMGSANITSYYGEVKNPWKRADGKDVVPGGSSGGSSSALAADLCLAALGTDTGGSIRQPASFTGTVGFKPTYGRCSRWGIVAFASSLDQAGPMTKSVRDAAMLFEVMGGHDPKDSTSSSRAMPNVQAALGGSIKGKKIGLPKEYRADGMDAEIDALWEKGANLLREAGAEVVEISLPHTKYALATYYIVAPAEASSNLSRYDGVKFGHRSFEKGDSIDTLYEKSRSEGFGDEVKRRILIGTYVLSAGYYDAYYLKAQRVRGLIIEDFKQAFSKVDAILTPTAPSAAFALGEEVDPVTMYLNDVFTVPASLAGLPAMSLPAGLNSEGLPLGLQLIGASYDEEGLFTVASALEEALEFNAKAGA